ncbi:unnamed protein product [Ilex paraguariensis]|uniref:Cytochrome P450 n=1 Tax=Ilex paraguariensis TaxID=185542 RepID=A0ABC8QX47_9AQUA
MVINESLRLYPPVVVVSREALTDMKFGNINVPKGVNLWTLVTTLHTDPEIWGPDSYKFNPDRFANGITGACKLPHLYMPFGVGPRQGHSDVECRRKRKDRDGLKEGKESYILDDKGKEVKKNVDKGKVVIKEVKKTKPRKEFKQKILNRFEALGLETNKQSLNLEAENCLRVDQHVVPISMGNQASEENDSLGEGNADGKKDTEVLRQEEEVNMEGKRNELVMKHDVVDPCEIMSVQLQEELGVEKKGWRIFSGKE